MQCLFFKYNSWLFFITFPINVYLIFVEISFVLDWAKHLFDFSQQEILIYDFHLEGKLKANPNKRRNSTKATHVERQCSEGKWEKKHNRGEKWAMQSSTAATASICIKSSCVKLSLIRLIACFKSVLNKIDCSLEV